MKKMNGYYLEEELTKRIKTIAEREKRSINFIVERILRNGLEKEE